MQSGSADVAPAPETEIKPFTASLIVPSPPAMASRSSAAKPFIPPQASRARRSASPRASVASSSTSAPVSRIAAIVRRNLPSRRRPAFGLKTTSTRLDCDRPDS